MNLKTQTDYGLRTLLYLGFVNDKVTVEAIASAYKISKDHLVKVVQQLVRMGYVRSQSGRTGGIRLARPTNQINIADVVRDFEGRSGVLPCVGEPLVCVLEPGCLLRTKLIEAEQAFYATLSNLTVADLLGPMSAQGAIPAPTGGLYNLTIRPRVAPGA